MVAARCRRAMSRDDVAGRLGQPAGLLEDLHPVAGRVAGEATAPAEDVGLVLPGCACIAQPPQHVVEVVDDEAEVRLRMYVAFPLRHMNLRGVVDVEPRARLRDTLLRLPHLTQ